MVAWDGFLGFISFILFKMFAVNSSPPLFPMIRKPEKPPDPLGISQVLPDQAFTVIALDLHRTAAASMVTAPGRLGVGPAFLPEFSVGSGRSKQDGDEKNEFVHEEW